MKALSFKGMPVPRRCQIARRRNISSYTLARSHTAMLLNANKLKKEKKKREKENKTDVLPFLPLVLHPTLSSFPSRIHTVSEESIHSREERRRRRSKRVRK